MAEPARPAGQPIRWTETQQLAQAIPTQADQGRAAALWQRLVPEPLRTLLGAQVQKEST